MTMSRRPSPRKTERLKRRMVQEVVQQNLDLINGRPSLAASLASRRQRILRGAALSLLLPAGVFASSLALSPNLGRSLGAGPRHERAAASVPLAAAQMAPATPAATEAAAPLPASLGPVAEQPLVLAVAPESIPSQLDAGLFPLAVRRVMIDPGHGGASLGTHTASGLTEKEITLDIGLRLQQLLAREGFEALLSRQNDEFVALRERARLANEAGADVFVSIHVNYIEDGAEIRGVETYYLGATDDPYIERFAADENRDSGYSLSELRSLLDRLFSGVRISKSRQLASAVQTELFRSLGKINPELRNRGVKSAPFLVLVDTQMPAILAEVSCLSNPREAALLAKPLYRQFIAESLQRGIVAYAGGAPAAAPKGS